MTFLHTATYHAYIWKGTLIFSALSLLVFMGLIAVRFAGDRKERIYNKKKEELEKIFFVYLDSPQEYLKSTLLEKSQDLSVLIEMIPDFLRPFTGKPYARLVSLLREIGLEEWIYKTLCRGRPKRKIQAINLSFHWLTPKIEQKLSQLIDDENSLISFAAMEAIAQAGERKHLGSIIQKLNQEKNFSYPLVSDIFKKFGPEVEPYLITALQKKDNSADMIRAILMTLGDFRSREAFRAVLPLFNHENQEVRSLTIRVLSYSGKELPLDFLERAQQDPYWRVRFHVTECATQLFPLPVGILLALLEDENWLVGIQAAKVLYQSGSAGRRLLSSLSQKKGLAANRVKSVLAEEGGARGYA